MKYGELLDRILEAQTLLLDKKIEANTVILNSNKYSVFIEPGYRPTVFGMAVEFANLPLEHDFIVQYKTRKTTNADRIRSMSDEELAEYLFERGNGDEYCYGICVHQDDIYACVNAMKQSKCIQGVIAWLKQESTDDHQSM